MTAHDASSGLRFAVEGHDFSRTASDKETLTPRMGATDAAIYSSHTSGETPRLKGF